MAAKSDSNRIYARVSGDLAKKIGSGQIAVGDRLPSERDLAQQYGISRPTIREAIIALEVDGLVEVRQGSGVFVIARSPNSGTAQHTDFGPFELIEARRAIEGEAAAIAAVHITQSEIATLRSLVSEMAGTNLNDDIVRSEEVDARFHRLIAEATRNSALVFAVENLWKARLRSPQSQMLSRKAHSSGVKPRIDEHVAIVDALEAGKAAEAREAMRAHLTRVLNTLLEVTEVQEVEEVRERLAAQRRRYRMAG